MTVRGGAINFIPEWAQEEERRFHDLSDIPEFLKIPISGKGRKFMVATPKPGESLEKNLWKEISEKN